MQIEKDKLIFENKLSFPAKEQGISLQHFQCSTPRHEVNSIRLDGSATTTAVNNQVISATIDGKLFDITLFTDRTFQQPVTDVSKLPTGSDVYVKVSSPVEEGILVVNECDLILNSNQGKPGSIVLTQHGYVDHY